MTEYNFQYLLDLCHYDDKIYEYNKIMNKVDETISNTKTPFIFHLVPIMYSISFFGGLSVFIYTMWNSISL